MVHKAGPVTPQGVARGFGARLGRCAALGGQAAERRDEKGVRPRSGSGRRSSSAPLGFRRIPPGAERRRLLVPLGIFNPPLGRTRHKLARPHQPQTTGKVERLPGRWFGSEPTRA